jgi:hypothetical protein
MKRTKISVLFLTAVVGAALGLSLLLPACSDGTEQGEYATVIISLGGSENSRQLVGLGTAGATTESHTYQLKIDSGEFKDFAPGDTLTVSATSHTFEIRAYGDADSVWWGTDHPFQPGASVLRAIGTKSQTIKTGENTVSIDLYSALDVSSWEELAWAVQGDDGSTRKETIILKGDMTAASQITIKRTIELRAEGGAVTITRSTSFTGSNSGAPGSFFSVSSGGILAIGATVEGESINSTITLDGGHDASSTSGTIIAYAPLITSSGDCIIGSGVTLQNNKNNNQLGDEYSAGGVAITGGTLTLYGKIIDNSSDDEDGGGVYITSGGSFLMEPEAVIRGNSAGRGGGVYVYGAGSTFIMSGGTISSNTANYSGGGVYILGADSTFTMNGGTISSNTAGDNGGGVYVGLGTFDISAAGQDYNSWVTSNSASPTGGFANVYIDDGTLNGGPNGGGGTGW